MNRNNLTRPPTTTTLWALPDGRLMSTTPNPDWRFGDTRHMSPLYACAYGAWKCETRDPTRIENVRRDGKTVSLLAWHSVDYTGQDIALTAATTIQGTQIDLAANAAKDVTSPNVGRLLGASSTVVNIGIEATIDISQGESGGTVLRHAGYNAASGVAAAGALAAVGLVCAGTVVCGVAAVGAGVVAGLATRFGLEHLFGK